MPVLVALLRGVNVGGHRKLPMAELRAIAEACGFERVRTYIQSGNLVLDAPAAADPLEVSARLRSAIGEQKGFEPDVLVRTGADLARVVEANPFLARGDDPAHLHVTFLDGDAAAALGELDLAPFAPEAAVPVGRELHLFLPDGMGRSALATELNRGGRPMAVGTTRNWRTLVALLALVDETADPSGK